MIKKEILAYLAGAVDSDGTIGIKKSTYAMRHNNGGGATYSERVALRQVTPEIPNLLHKTFHGALYMTKPSAKMGRQLYSWAVTDIRAVSCLSVLLPFLRVKSDQARNCLALRVVKNRSKKVRVAFGRGHVGAAARPMRITERMDAFYIRAKTLNRVGV